MREAGSTARDRIRLNDQWDITEPSWRRNELTDLRYINRRLIDSYLEQTGGIPREKLSKKSIGLLGGILNFSLSSEDSENHISDYAKLDTLVSRLSRKRLITGERPRRAPEFSAASAPLVLETFVARQFIFPVSRFETLNGIRNLKVWVGEPDPEHFIDEEFAWNGAYLFLTELEFDSGEHTLAISGCSALRYIFNRLENRNPFDRSGHEILGRFDYRSIQEKLFQMGADELSGKKITSLYKIRYMTDEQFFPGAPQNGRVHDILGYPIFIAD